MIRISTGAGCLAVLALLSAGCMPPSWGANALLHPGRRPPKQDPTRAFESVKLEGAGVHLVGWRFRGEGPIKRGTVVYLHGAGDSRRSSLGIADHFVPAGFDVLAYDSRAHGDSQGESCTYGVYEKRDLALVLSHVEARPIILLGLSLGAAVALQTAAETPDVAAVIAIATFSDLRAVARDRAPFFASNRNIEDAFAIAEREGRFHVDEASPLAAAPHIKVPTLIIHGASDDETPPIHSQRVYDSLGGPKQLIYVPGAGHNNALNATVWRQLDQWLRAALPEAVQSRAGLLHATDRADARP
jgi:pimeloyl-ACP methyl ester carboxylesterase